MNLLGKGPGYVLLGLAELVAVVFVIKYAPQADLTGLAFVLGAINAGVYGGGAFKAHTEAKNGKS